MKLLNKEIRPLHILLIAAILLGIFARFHGLGSNYLYGDEGFYTIAAEKYHAGSQYDVRLWNYENPPIAKVFMSIPLIFKGGIDYSIPVSLPPNLYVYIYLASASIKQVFESVRFVSALFGLAFIILTYFLTKKFFGKDAAIWSATIISLSIDYILLSRVVLLDIYLFFFLQLTAFSYLLYKAKNNNPKYLGLFFVSFLLTVGTKNFQSLLILPPIILYEILSNKNKIGATINFIIIVAVAIAVVNYIIYPPSVSSEASKTLGLKSAADIFMPNIPNFFKSIISINSLLFLFSIVLLAGYLISMKKSTNMKLPEIKSSLLKPTPLKLLIYMIVFNILVFSLTTLSINPKYITQMSLPLFVLGGVAIANFWKRKEVKAAVLILLAISAFSVVYYFPKYENYKMFELASFGNPSKEVEPYIQYLENLGNPPIITNNLNLLIFYKGEASHAPPMGQSCNEQLINYISVKKPIGIYYNMGEKEKTFFCDQIFQYNGTIDNVNKAEGSLMVYYGSKPDGSQ